MKKKIGISLGAIVGVLVIGLLVAGNYFYSEGIKRGTDIELHSEPASVNALASETALSILEEAEKWYADQEKEVLEITSYDNLLLKAGFLENDLDNGKAVILAHGYRGKHDDMDDLVKFYYDRGFDVLMPDARGHGESEGDYIGYGWHDRLDYLKWIDLLIEQYGAEHIFLHGNSMGASLVLMTSGEDLPGEVKGIIADSGYTTVKEELRHQLKYLYHLPSFPILDVTSVITKVRAGYYFGEASAIDQVKNNTKPLFIIHGDADELVPTQMAHELYEAAGGDKELWIVPNAGHTKAYSVATEEFQSRLQQFINKALEVNPNEVEVSSLFEANNYTMIGEEGRIGFIYDGTDVTRFIPNQAQKYMWHFWGEPDELDGEFQVIGKNVSSGEELLVFEAGTLGGSNNGADAHLPSSMSLPSEGVWELQVYVGGDLFGTVVVECRN
ncbi:alpha/beta fold hydrolase [Ornithinibacillus sp. 179-J 7C1 HS]|uniref:alpha/beta fold hydrolase n=1 Tax=Ornithinibacillus sp. 179-J 7C1 HS TaxID=3142384 RepID=UPI0039A37CD9